MMEWAAQVEVGIAAGTPVVGDTLRDRLVEPTMSPDVRSNVVNGSSVPASCAARAA